MRDWIAEERTKPNKQANRHIIALKIKKHQTRPREQASAHCHGSMENRSRCSSSQPGGKKVRCWKRVWMPAEGSFGFLGPRSCRVPHSPRAPDVCSCFESTSGMHSNGHELHGSRLWEEKRSISRVSDAYNLHNGLSNAPDARGCPDPGSQS